jgi:hypothetical protein
MAITYNLNIGSLKRKLSVDGLENVIIEVSVGVSAQSQEYPQFSYSCGGNVSFDISEIDSDSFVPFEEVTKETVIGWLLAKEGVDTVEEFSYVKASIDNIQARIDELQVEDSVNVGWSVTNAPEPEVVAEAPQEEIPEA